MKHHYALRHPDYDKGVWFPRDSRNPIQRAQNASAELHSVIEGADPSSSFDGLQPGTVVVSGYWLFENAEQNAKRLRTQFFDDPGVEEVQLTAIDDDGNTVSTQFSGTYLLATGSDQVNVVKSRAGAPWEYIVALTEP